MLKNLKQKIFLSTAFAAIIYLALIIYADFESFINAFSQFNLYLIPVLLALSFLNYVTRFFKWHYYINLLKVKLSKKDSFAIFMSGLIMSVTPGKFGEMLKAYLVKQITGEPISKTAPIIIVERITDLISLIFLGLLGAFIFDYGKVIISIVGLIFLLVIIFIGNKKISLSIIDTLSRIKFLSKYTVKFHNAYESSYTMLRPKPFYYMLFVSLISWFFECFGFYLILLNFGFDFSFLWPTFVYSFSTIVGSISMLPGGLGFTEGSLTFLLIRSEVSIDIAVASTFILRAVTLWFAVAVGIISILIYQKRFGKIQIDLLNN